MELSKERRQCNDGHVMIVAGGADRGDLVVDDTTIDD